MSEARGHTLAHHGSVGFDAVDFTAVDEIFARFHADGAGAPGVAYGIVHGGRVVHGGGYGLVGSESPGTPGPATVFRIASLSKSFTAAAILSLRDEGVLRLDDPVGEHVPMLARLPRATRDSPPITVADCLTMSAGLPTDDAWADRQEELTEEALGALLSAGIGYTATPGTRFEYANLGYVFLGQVVESLTGRPFTQVVSDRFLQPLGMSSTTYDYRDVAGERLATGYHRVGDRWEPQAFTAPGMFSAIGGVLSTVEDLAVWVHGFASAFPARDEPEGGHPLARATRRSMQQQHRAITPLVSMNGHGLPDARTGEFPWGLSGYGYGLFVEYDPRWGEFVHHIGGYPGFGSHMRWHRETGIGVVAFGNARYCPVYEPADAALRQVLDAVAPPSRTVVSWPVVHEARQVVDRLVDGDESAVRDPVFSPTLFQDEPAAARLTALDEAHQQVGALTGPAERLSAATPGHLVWWRPAEHGRIRHEMWLTPTVPAKVQRLQVDAVPDPSPEFAPVIECVVEALAGKRPDWPEHVAPAGDTTPEELVDELSRARDLIAPVGPAAVIGATSPDDVVIECVGRQGAVEVRMARTGDRVRLDLALRRTPEDYLLRRDQR
ncbi:serine hydrolase domain-containing protein [Microtetraspora malaysiensis]|uniref:serine hydrolase domain-containing protein n=1 Tax=Microtetraspora malaysiensis TaxID=161358 RepID=UPI003D91C0B1